MPVLHMSRNQTSALPFSKRAAEMLFPVFYVLLMNSAASTATETSYCKGCRSMGWILRHFNPIYDTSGDGDLEDCTDPCVQNVKYLDEGNKEYEDQHCTVPHTNCTGHGTCSPYRTLDGSCNNLCHPEWGKSNTCHRRFLPHDYGDGKSHPRKSCLKEDLPNSRLVSNVIHKETKIKTQDRRTLHFMEWGQVISHDVSLAAVPKLPERGPGSCCDPIPRVDDVCIATEVPVDDDFYPGKRSCLSFTRTLKCPLCSKGVRQSLNKNTAYFDLSVVYGSTFETLKSLRSWRNGMLKTRDFPNVGPLPPGIKEIALCKSRNSTTGQCFNAGDIRINQNVLLTSYHIILLRNHNNICQQLRELNRHWSDDKLFQEARKINIAQAQMITFGYYLKIVLGSRLTREFQLDVLPGRNYSYYDKELDASVFDEYAAVAQRYGHSQIPNTFLEKDPVTGKSHVIRIEDFYNWPFDYYRGQLDRLTLGMAHKKPRAYDVFLSSGVRNHLYDNRTAERFVGTDLAAISISRGREHGVPGYPYYLKYFFDYDVHSFCDLRKFIPHNIIQKLRKLYRSVHDVDLYTALFAEYHIDGAIVGPTTAAILLLQYKRMKFGDRHYFEHRCKSSAFTPEQLQEIKSKTNLARIFCETTKISKIQPDVFSLPSARNKFVSCRSLPALDISHWAE